MESNQYKIFKFSINNWGHLYSLEHAIARAEKATGKTLSIEGTVRNADLLDNKDLPIKISFNQVDGIPEYQQTSDSRLVLGQLKKEQDKLSCTLPVDDKVFEELRKNLMEYADIDGIHIVVTIGILIGTDSWPTDTTVDIVKLDYAMKGDA